MIDRGRQLTLCLHAQVGGAAEKVTLLVLLDFYGSRGNAFPSYDTIAACANFSRSTAIRAVARLQEIGVVTVEERTNKLGRQTSNLYAINFGRLKELQPQGAPTRARGVTVEPPGGVALTPSGVSPCNPRGVRVTPDPPNVTAQSDPPRVEPLRDRKVESETASSVKVESLPPNPPSGAEERAPSGGDSVSMERRKAELQWSIAIGPLIGRHTHGRHAAGTPQANADRTAERIMFDEIVYPDDAPDGPARTKRAIELVKRADQAQKPMAYLTTLLQREWPDDWASSTFAREAEAKADRERANQVRERTRRLGIHGTPTTH